MQNNDAIQFVLKTGRFLLVLSQERVDFRTVEIEHEKLDF